MSRATNQNKTWDTYSWRGPSPLTLETEHLRENQTLEVEVKRLNPYYITVDTEQPYHTHRDTRPPVIEGGRRIITG